MSLGGRGFFFSFVVGMSPFVLQHIEAVGCDNILIL